MNNVEFLEPKYVSLPLNVTVALYIPAFRPETLLIEPKPSFTSIVKL